MKVIFTNVIKVERVEIPEEVYTNWGTDDQIIIDYVLNTLSLQIAPVVIETVSTEENEL